MHELIAVLLSRLPGPATEAAASVTRPNDTIAYAQYDLIANSVTNTSVVPMQFAVARVPGGSGLIRRLRLRKGGNVLTNASFRLHLYKSAPTVVNGDNGAWSTSGSASYLGCIDVTMDKQFTDGAEGDGVPAGGDITFKLAAGVSVVYGLLEVRSGSGYTPVASEIFSGTLEVIQD